MHAPAPRRFRDAPPFQLRRSNLKRKKEAARGRLPSHSG